MRLEELGFSEWEDALPNDGFGAFHSTNALRVLDEHAPGDLRLFGGFKGQEPVGLAPMFVRRGPIGRLVASPPLGFGIGRLGPMVMPTSPKRRKKEAVTKEFIEKLIEATDADSATTLFRMACGTRYGDPRPFDWAGFDVTPAFTYRLDLDSTDTDQLLDSFSRDRRGEIRNRDEAGVSVRTGGRDDAKRTYAAMRRRYREQGQDVPLSWEFVRDLLDALGDRARVYIAESADGEFLSGMLVVYSNDTAYNWKGGTKPTDRDVDVSPNSLLHWRIIEDVLTDPSLDSIERYDMYTANNERLVRYKSSFGGELSPYYIIESAGLPLKVAKGVYRMAVLRKDPRGRRSLIPNR